MQTKAVTTKILSMSLDTWYNVAQIVGVGLVALTFAVAAATFGIGYFLNKKKDAQARQQEERIAELTLKAEALNVEAEKAKTERAQADLKIEEARERASKADERAEKANERAGGLELRAQELARQNLEVRAGVANLETEAANAQAEQQRIQTELARQQERAAKAERILEAERLERLKIEEALAPRMIVNPLVMADVLRKFPGVTVIIERVRDWEAEQVDFEISSALEMAGWHITGRAQAPMLTRNVSIQALHPFAQQGEDRAPFAADALVEQLRANGIEVQREFRMLLPANTLKIVIGLKDPTYLRKKREERLFRSFIFGEPTDPILQPLRELPEFRYFDEEKQRKFSQALVKTAWAEKKPVQLRCPAHDKEACGFAMEMAVLLRRGGWEIQNNSVMRDKEFPSMSSPIEFKFPESGIVVSARSLEHNHASMAVGYALEEAGFPPQRMTEIFDSAAPLLILVSRSPE